jgi:hypothetical protein
MEPASEMYRSTARVNGGQRLIPCLAASSRSWSREASHSGAEERPRGLLARVGDVQRRSFSGATGICSGSTEEAGRGRAFTDLPEGIPVRSIVLTEAPPLFASRRGFGIPWTGLPR